MPAHNRSCQPQNPSRWNPSWLRDPCATRKEPESDQMRAKRDDWPETTWKTNLTTITLRLQATWQEQFSWVPLPPCSLPGLPFSINLLLCQYVCLLGQFISKCQTRAHSRALEGIPLPATLTIYHFIPYPFPSLSCTHKGHLLRGAGVCVSTSRPPTSSPNVLLHAPLQSRKPLPQWFCFVLQFQGPPFALLLFITRIPSMNIPAFCISKLSWI